MASMYLCPGLVTQLCLPFCNSIDCSLPTSSVHGILQARKQEWVAISFSRASSQSRNQTRSPTLQADSLPSEPQESPLRGLLSNIYSQFGFFFFFSLIPIQHLQLLSCGKSNCSFCTVEICFWYWNTFLNKCGYVTHYLMHISCFMGFFWLLTYYLLSILYLF